MSVELYSTVRDKFLALRALPWVERNLQLLPSAPFMERGWLLGGPTGSPSAAWASSLVIRLQASLAAALAGAGVRNANAVNSNARKKKLSLNGVFMRSETLS